MVSMWNRSRSIGLIASAVVLLGLVFGAGLIMGIRMPGESKIVGLVSKEPVVPKKEVDFGTFWDAWGLVEQKYVDRDALDHQKMVYGAVSGLVKSLGDPYTVFFPPEEHKDFQNEIRGEFEGVGMEVGMRKNILTVVAPLKGTPAERAGVLSGDKIVRINDTSTADLSVEEAVRLIRGPRGTTVKLTMLRNGQDEPKIIEVTRELINIPVIDTESKATAIAKGDGGAAKKTIEDSEVFVIRLYNFSESSAFRFRDALRAMISENKKKLILDLRNNPGGYLESAVDMASWFLPQGTPIVSEQFAHDEKRVHRSYGYNVFKELDVIILVNQGSASASEILAGALRDHGIAKLVGEKTFGKGSVQELIPLTSDTSVKITIAKWVTPKGQALSDGGLTPDYEVKPSKEDIEAGRDPVMEKAINVLKGK